jgi:hypothetical protein
MLTTNISTTPYIRVHTVAVLTRNEADASASLVSNQAGGTCKDALAAEAAAVPSSLSSAISSTTELI